MYAKLKPALCDSTSSIQPISAAHRVLMQRSLDSGPRSDPVSLVTIDYLVEIEYSADG